MRADVCLAIICISKYTFVVATTIFVTSIVVFVWELWFTQLYCSTIWMKRRPYLLSKHQWLFNGDSCPNNINNNMATDDLFYLSCELSLLSHQLMYVCNLCRMEDMCTSSSCINQVMKKVKQFLQFQDYQLISVIIWLNGSNLPYFTNPHWSYSWRWGIIHHLPSITTRLFMIHGIYHHTSL